MNNERKRLKMKYIFFQVCVIFGLVYAINAQRLDKRELLDAIGSAKERTQRGMDRVEYGVNTGWNHDGWCTLMPCCQNRCVCHDKCGPICGTWRQNVIAGKIPIDSGLETGEWLVYDDILESLRLTADIVRGKERRKAATNEVVRLCDWMEEEKRRADARHERVRRELAPVIGRIGFYKGED